VNEIVPINVFPFRPINEATLASDPRCSAPGVFLIVAPGPEPRWAFVGQSDVSIGEAIRALGRGRGPLASLVSSGGTFAPVVIRDPAQRRAAAFFLIRELAPTYNEAEVAEPPLPCELRFHGPTEGRPPYTPGTSRRGQAA
jgi:hypothetical protein